ncbi:MAG TPA: DUF4142 domain-containing protein [Phycisphaerales bacterium]|nr:DUF4142 domain-containing protein [Phycisphaerales bacterium]
MNTSHRIAILVTASAALAGCTQYESWRDGRRNAIDLTSRRDAGTAYSNSGQGGGFSTQWQATSAGLMQPDRLSTDRIHDDRRTWQDDRTVADARTSDETGKRTYEDRTQRAVTSADQQILATLHTNNQEQIALGRLAQSKGATEEVRAYGTILARDHAQNDEKLARVAKETGFNLNSTQWRATETTTWSEGKRTTEQQRSMTDPVRTDKAAGMPTDTHHRLQSLSGSDFDRQFSQHMVQGHRDLITTVEQAISTASDRRVRSYLDATLDTLREHETRVTRLVSTLDNTSGTLGQAPGSDR